MKWMTLGLMVMWAPSLCAAEMSQQALQEALTPIHAQEVAALKTAYKAAKKAKHQEEMARIKAALKDLSMQKKKKALLPPQRGPREGKPGDIVRLVPDVGSRLQVAAVIDAKTVAVAVFMAMYKRQVGSPIVVTGIDTDGLVPGKSYQPGDTPFLIVPDHVDGHGKPLKCFERLLIQEK